jgi:hypothetical protein
MIRSGGNPLLYNLREHQYTDCYAVLATQSNTGKILAQVSAQTSEFALRRIDLALRNYAKSNGFDGIEESDDVLF